MVVALRIGEANPKVLGRGYLKLNITSYGLFNRVARDAIATLGIPHASDPNAGLPEPLSQAEQELQPQLYAQAQVRRRPRHPGRPRHAGRPPQATIADRQVAIA